MRELCNCRGIARRALSVEILSIGAQIGLDKQSMDVKKRFMFFITITF